MKKCSSVVWRFFDRLGDETGRCVGVLCKLCDCQYKYFGNTTNLRVHLINKHPIQWELSQNGTLDESNFLKEDDETASTPKQRKRRSTRDKNVRYSISVDKKEDSAGAMPKIEIQRVDVLENSGSDNDNPDDANTTINLVRQMHTNAASDEEWIEDDPYQITHIETYEPKPKRKRMKYRKIKREVASPTELPGYYVAPKPESTVLFDDTPRKDEYSLFGEYVANKLRKVKTPRTRGNLQQLITTILWQAEYGMYDNAEAVKRVLMYSVQSPEPEQHTETVVEFEPQQLQTVHIQEEVIEQKFDGTNQRVETEVATSN